MMHSMYDMHNIYDAWYYGWLAHVAWRMAAIAAHTPQRPRPTKINERHKLNKQYCPFLGVMQWRLFVWHARCLAA